MTQQNQTDDPAVDEKNETQETPNEEEFNLEDDARADIYSRLDKANQERQTSQPFLFGGEVEDEDEQPSEEDTEGEPSEKEPPKSKEEPAESEQPRTEEKPALGKDVLTREEFEEIFKDIKIKTKMAGEEIEAPVSEFLKAQGLEKHYTKRLQELSRREREILEAAKKGELQGEPGPSDEEVQERYDELYHESPYKAQKYLQTIEEQRRAAQESMGKARVDRAVSDFKSVYPDCSDKDWDAMNDPAFWNKHDDIVKLRESGDVFSTLVTAYTRLQQTKVTAQAAMDAQKSKEKAQPADKTDRKKQGQVVRTVVKPQTPVAKKRAYEEQSPRDYIEALRRQARERMNIK